VLTETSAFVGIDVQEKEQERNGKTASGPEEQGNHYQQILMH
jgi:hypothetical protein